MNNKAIILCFSLLLFACNQKELLFKNPTSQETGLNFKNTITPSNELNILDYLYYYNGGGVALGDINNDGLLDIFLSANQEKNKLFINKGNLKFEDITNKANVSGNSSWNTGAVMGDINGDGYLDLALTYMGEWWFGQPGAQGSISKFYGANTYLLISKGNLQYDVTEIINNLDNQAQFNVNLFDWDFDGKVDVLPNSMSEGSYFKNMGNNTFEKKSISPLFSQMIGNKLDYDKDGKLDFVNLYVRQKDENGNYNTNNSAQTLTVTESK